MAKKIYYNKFFEFYSINVYFTFTTANQFIEKTKECELNSICTIYVNDGKARKIIRDTVKSITDNISEIIKQN